MTLVTLLSKSFVCSAVCSIELGSVPDTMVAGRLFRPDEIRIRYVSNGNGWRMLCADVSGPVIKVDGTLSDRGARRTRTTYGPTTGYYPEWVSTAVLAHLPRN